MESAVDRQIKELREEFINEVFEIKDDFVEGSTSEDQDIKDEAYQTLIDMLKKYIEKFVRLEKNKYMRERVYYQRSGQISMYERANKCYNNCRADVEDNVIKQIRTILKPN